MALKKNNTGLEELLLQCLSEPDPMLSMPDRLCGYIPFFVTERKRSENALIHVI